MPNPNIQAFNNDSAALSADIAKYSTIVQQSEQDDATFLSQLQKISADSKKNPAILLYELLALLMSQGSEVLSDQMGIRGAQLQVEVDVNKCNTDLLGMTNDTTETAGNNGGGKTLLNTFATDVNTMLALCGSSTSPSPLENILGSGATGSLAENFQTLRNMVYTGGTVPGDPPITTTGSGSSAVNTPGSGTYFNTSSTTFTPSLLTSFAQMHADAAKQGTASQELASGADTEITQNFGTNTSLLSSVQAQVNVWLGQIKNAINTIQSFASDIGHGLSSINSVAIQNQTRG